MEMIDKIKYTWTFFILRYIYITQYLTSYYITYKIMYGIDIIYIYIYIHTYIYTYIYIYIQYIHCKHDNYNQTVNNIVSCTLNKLNLIELNLIEKGIKLEVQHIQYSYIA